jgi:hypothetical protein
VFIELATASFLVGSYVYFRLTEDKPTKKSPPREVQIPRVEVGVGVPMFYGRVRARGPILAAASTPVFDDPSYEMNMFFALGFPFADGAGTNRVHNMWAGDWLLNWTDNAPLMTGDGGPEGPVIVIGTGQNGDELGTGLLEFLNGKSTQELVDALGTPTTFAGEWMLRAVGDPAGGLFLPVDEIPGYRGMLSVFLYGTDNGRQWRFGASPTVPSYSFECSTYHTNHPQLGTYARVGDDSNPMNVIYDVLVHKAGIPESYIDIPNFQQNQFTLHTESHGYSRCFEDAAEVDEVLGDVLRQIDGVLRHNPVTDKLEVKLIRPDFDPTEIPHITKDNCVRLQSFAMGGWADVTNALRLVYTSRASDYQEADVTDENQANAGSIGQNVKNLLVLMYPGICVESLARAVARRELAARSRPIIKMRAIVGREFLHVLQGDAVKVTLKNPDLAGLIFRVANVEHGTLEDGAIALDLLLDFNYTYRNETSPPSGTDFGGMGGDLDAG